MGSFTKIEKKLENIENEICEIKNIIGKLKKVFKNTNMDTSELEDLHLLKEALRRIR